MKWTRVRVTVSRELYEPLVAALLRCGIEEHELVEDGENTSLVYYVAGGTDPCIEKIKAFLKPALLLCQKNEEEENLPAGIKKGKRTLKKKDNVIFFVEEITDSNWQSAFLESYHSFKIGKKFLIAPTWEKIADNCGRIILRIDPGQAFGTGLHETTAMALESLEKNIKPGMKILDAGTGSGILAIAAAALGATVVATDNDPTAISVASENSAINRVSDNITLIETDLVRGVKGRFDIIVANILLEPVIRLLEYAGRLLSGTGLFIGTGILVSQKRELKKALEKNGFSCFNFRTRGEWLLVEAHRVTTRKVF